MKLGKLYQLIIFVLCLLCISGCSLKKTVPAQNEGTTESVSNTELYEGNHMSFSYDNDLIVTSIHDSDYVSNAIVINQEKTFSAANVIYKSDEMKSEAFFENIYNTFNYSEEVETGELVIKKANEGRGAKAYKEYYLNDENYKIIAQLQSFADTYYIATIVVLNEVNDKNQERADRILNSVIYTDSESKEGLADTPEECQLPLILAETYLMVEHGFVFDYGSDNLDEYYKKVDELKADTTYKPNDNYEYLKNRDIASFEGSVYQIAVPQSEYADDKMTYSYNNHGVGITIYLTQKYKNDLNNIIDNNDYVFDMYKENKKDYTNIEESDYIEKDNFLYKILTADYIDYDNFTTKVYSVVCAIPQKNKDVLCVNFDLREMQMDADTKKLLEELETEYKVPLCQYAIDDNMLTFSGRQIDRNIEDYVYDGQGSEVTEMEGYELLGKTRLVHNGVSIDLLVPMGSRTRVYDSFASGSMHGVETNISFQKGYSNFDLLEETIRDTKKRRDYIEKSARDYSNVSEVFLARDNTETAALGSFSYDKKQYDGSVYQMQEIQIRIMNDADTKHYTQIDITLNQADFDNRTELLLQEISKAYGIDYLELTEIALSKIEL